MARKEQDKEVNYRPKNNPSDPERFQRIKPNLMGRDSPANERQYEGTNKDYYKDVRDAMEEIVKEKRK